MPVNSFRHLEHPNRALYERKPHDLRPAGKSHETHNNAHRTFCSAIQDPKFTRSLIPVQNDSSSLTNMNSHHVPAHLDLE